jgi:putative ABC transport system permease protein
MLGTKGRFLAIFSIVTLGVGFLAGLMSTSPDIEDSVERYLDGQNLYDFRVVSTLGLTEDDLAALRQVEGVESVRGACSADLLVQADGGDVMVARAHTLPEDADGSPEGTGTIDRLMLTEGRWPQAPGECVVESGGSMVGQKLSLGDTITCTADNADLSDKMAQTQFTVVGRVRDAYYFSYEREPASVGNGSVGVVFYVQKQAFAYDVYTEAYATVTGARELRSLSEEYRTTVQTVTDRVDGIAGAREQARYDSVRADAQKEIDDAWAEYRDAKADADTQLADAAQELDDGRQALTDGEQQLADAQTEYDSGSAEVEQNQATINSGDAAIQDALAQLNDALAQYDSASRQLSEGESQLAAGKTTLDAAQQQYETGEKTYQDGLAQVQTGEKQYSAGIAQLAQLRQLNAAQTGYDSGVQALIAAGAAADTAGAEALFSDAALDAVRAQLEQLGMAAQADAACQAAQTDYRQAYQAALDAATPESGFDPDTDAVVAEKKAAMQTAQGAWYGVLMAADPSLTDPTDPAQAEHLAAAETAMRQQTAALEARKMQLEQLRQLNTLQKTLNAAAEQMVTSGAAENTDAARALWSTESVTAVEEQLEKARTKLDETGAQLAAARTQLDSAKTQLEAGWREYNEKSTELAAGKSQLAGAKRTIDEGFATLTEKQVQLADAREKIASARSQLADARQSIADGRATLAEKQQELADGETDYASAKAEAETKLSDGKAKIEDAEAQLADLAVPTWYVWDRQNNVSCASFQGNVNKVAALAKVFPVFFFLVAALVVLTTMTRMVDEERLQIGTMKALGYANGAIMAKYLFYSLAAALTGAITGLAVGFQVFPTVIWNAYAMIYYQPSFSAPWRWNYALVSGGALVGCALAATYVACHATLRESPAALMRPRAPKAGKRVLLEYCTPLWNRLSFSYKVTVRNLMRYKKRFWMTVVGVAGCTALLLTGFGISDSINGIITKQYNSVYSYDLMTTVQHPEDTSSGEVSELLFGGGEITQSLVTATEKVNESMPDGTSKEAYLMVPEDRSALEDFIHLRERVSRKKITLGTEGVVLTEKFADALKAGVGDKVTLQNSDGAEASFTVTGVTENYVYNYIYLSEQAYAQGFGTAPKWNAVLSRLNDTAQAEHDALSAELLGMAEVSSVNFTADTTRTVLNMLNSINAIVVVVVICAAALAFVVLYNLTNINIAERVKEIATIKVLGFYDPEVSAYVMRENIVLSLIGAVFGLGGGVLLHRFVILTVEVDNIMFGRTIDFSSYVYAFVLTMAFSMLVNAIMSRKLKKISMVESMKAPE